MYLLNDTGTALLKPGIVPNSRTGTMENAQRRPDGAQINRSESGDNMVLGVNITVKPAFTGPKIVFTGIQSTSANSDWSAVGACSAP